MSFGHFLNNLFQISVVISQNFAGIIEIGVDRRLLAQECLASSAHRAPGL
jgi:hypothetical protein